MRAVVIVMACGVLSSLAGCVSPPEPLTPEQERAMRANYGKPQQRPMTIRERDALDRQRYAVAREEARQREEERRAQREREERESIARREQSAREERQRNEEASRRIRAEEEQRRREYEARQHRAPPPLPDGVPVIYLGAAAGNGPFGCRVKVLVSNHTPNDIQRLVLLLDVENGNESSVEERAWQFIDAGRDRALDIDLAQRFCREQMRVVVRRLVTCSFASREALDCPSLLREGQITINNGRIIPVQFRHDEG